MAEGLVRALGAAGLHIACATGVTLAGTEAVCVPRPASVMGLLDAVRAVRQGQRALEELAAWARRRRPRVLVTIDGPSFTLRLSRALRPLPSVHVVAPQVWAWRPGRVDRMAAATDVVLCLLPFEPAWFEGRLRAVFVGHPATDLVPDPRGPRPAVALLPGSRPSEVRRLAPVLREIADRLRADTPGLGLLTVRAPSVPALDVPGLCTVERVEHLAGVAGAVAASGTVTLQLAALGIPQVVLARTDPLSWALGPSVVRTPWVALPNILAGRPVVAEHVQHLDPAAIVRDLGHAGPAPLPDLDGHHAYERMAEEVLARVVVAP